MTTEANRREVSRLYDWLSRFNLLQNLWRFGRLRADLTMHGKTSVIRHDREEIFQTVPSPFTAARYHSLMVNLDSRELKVTARSEDDVVMGMSHPEYPLHGVQFHPESFLSEHGFTLIENFLKLVGDIDTGFSLGPEMVEDIHKGFDFRFGEGRGRFVKDQNLGVFGKHLGDFDHLLLADAETPGCR